MTTAETTILSLAWYNSKSLLILDIITVVLTPSGPQMSLDMGHILPLPSYLSLSQPASISHHYHLQDYMTSQIYGWKGSETQRWFWGCAIVELMIGILCHIQSSVLSRWGEKVINLFNRWLWTLVNTPS